VSLVSTSKRNLFIVAVLVVGGIIALSQLSNLQSAKVTYRTAPVSEGLLRDVVTASGTVNALVTVEVGSQLSGRIAKLRADFNDVVSKDQPLAVLDQQSYRARLFKAKAAVGMARATVEVKAAELDHAKQGLLETKARKEIHIARLEKAEAEFISVDANLKRKETLRTRGSVSLSDLQEAKANERAAYAAVREAKANLSTHSIKVAAAEAEVTRYAAQLKNAEFNVPEREADEALAEVELERTRIRSPIDGIVIGRNVDEGQTVAASLEAPTLFTIAQDLTEMEVHARVDETDIGKIKLTQKATFTVDAFPGRTFSGKVGQIRKAPEVIQNVVIYTVVIKTKNEDLSLLPGMTALVQVVVMESEKSLLVPTAALQYRPSGDIVAKMPQGGGKAGKVVWRLENDKPAAAIITTGASDTRSSIISKGELNPGDQVIVGEVVQQTSRSLFGVRLGF
jgi:HlyD family secretion protein